MKIQYSEAQERFFFDSDAKFRLMPKGRRCGFTHGSANFLVDSALDNQFANVLWVDTIYSNIDRYVDRYFMPLLRQLPKKWYEWRQQAKEMKILNTTIDFRSADRPENIEGFGYHKFLLNEAGIILKGQNGKYLWRNVVVPMLADYDDARVYIGGTPKGRKDKDGQENLYYAMCRKAEAGEPGYMIQRVATDENPFLSDQGIIEVLKELPEGAIRDQEFFGKFVEQGAGVIKREWFTIDNAPISGRRIRGWDLAVTEKKSSDSTAGALLCIDGNGKIQVQGILKVKKQWPELRELIAATALQDGTAIPIVLEHAGQQIALINDLQSDPRLGRHTILARRPDGSKVARAMPWVSRLESGRMSLLSGAWNEGFIEECECFSVDDTHSHDDQIDAVSLAFSELQTAQVQVLQGLW